jgi:hypothetical protein
MVLNGTHGTPWSPGQKDLRVKSTMKFRIVQKKGEFFGAKIVIRFFAGLQSWDFGDLLKTF